MMTRARVQANYPTAGDIHGLLSNLEQVKFHRPRLSTQVGQRLAALSFFDE